MEKTQQASAWRVQDLEQAKNRETISCRDTCLGYNCKAIERDQGCVVDGGPSRGLSEPVAFELRLAGWVEPAMGGAFYQWGRQVVSLTHLLREKAFSLLPTSHFLVPASSIPRISPMN